MCTVGGRIGWIGTRSGTARRPGIAGPTTEAMEDSSPVAGAGVDMVEGKESLINPYLKVGSPR